MALAQVLVTTAVLALIAAGVMQVMFSDYTLATRNVNAAKYRYWAEACLAQKTPKWAGSKCGGAASDSCNFGPTGPVVNISCSGAGTALTFTVTW